MESFILNLASGWTILDLTIMFILLLVAYMQYKKVQAKENLLKFSDIQRKQDKDEIEFLLAEIKDSNIENAVLLQSKYDLIESRDYWKERSLHKKHTANKVADSKTYKAISDKYLPLFLNGNYYKVDHSKTSFSETLFLVNEQGFTNLVEKKYFQSVS